MTHSTYSLEHTVWQQISRFTYDTLPGTVCKLFGCIRTKLSAVDFQLFTVSELNVSHSWSVLTFIVSPLNPDVHTYGLSYFHFKCPTLQLGERSFLLSCMKHYI